MEDAKKRIVVGIAAIMLYPMAMGLDLAVWGCKVFELEILRQQSDGHLISLLILSVVLKCIAFGSVLSLISRKKDAQVEEEISAL
ncbi:MAG: hypothetical protein J6V95_04760 [Bacteroidaceae bacterium]|nr:hypothetical protein [Bacteroidaceae bacterium]